MNKSLRDKRILFICPKFFNYHIEFKEELEALGAYVDYFDERPSNNNFIKAILRINKNLINGINEKYYNEVYSKIKNNKYDYMLVVKPEAIPQRFIDQFKEMNPEAKVCMYLWDSLENNKAAKSKIEKSDSTFSFDPEDCKKHNLKFRPLFFNNKYEKIATKNNENNKYDLLFVGTVHSDRYAMLKALQDDMNENGKKVYLYMYMQSRLIYYLKKIFLKEFKKSKITEFKFKPISQSDLVKLVEASNVVVDIQHPKQTGLTMRSIEMLGANKKMITTNNKIKNYDFYDGNNIQIVDRELKNIDIEFFNRKFNEVSENIKEKYSLKSWLLEILS